MTAPKKQYRDYGQGQKVDLGGGGGDVTFRSASQFQPKDILVAGVYLGPFTGGSYGDRPKFREEDGTIVVVSAGSFTNKAFFGSDTKNPSIQPGEFVVLTFQGKKELKGGPTGTYTANIVDIIKHPDLNDSVEAETVTQMNVQQAPTPAPAQIVEAQANIATQAQQAAPIPQAAPATSTSDILAKYKK